MEREPYFSIATGEGNFNEALKARGLTGVWNAKYPPDERVPDGHDHKLEWRKGDWTATAARFHRAPNGSPLVLYAILLTMTGTEELAGWHKSAIGALSRAATQGNAEFERTVQQLTGAA